MATIAERTGWDIGFAKGVNPADLALLGAADSPIDTVLSETVGIRPDGKAIIHVTNVLRDDSYSARRRKGIDTRKGIRETDGKHGKCYIVDPTTGKRTEISVSGKARQSRKADIPAADIRNTFGNL